MSRDPAQRLGRGLAALFGEGAERQPDHGTARPIATHLLNANPHQPRRPVDPASLLELAHSLRTQGMLQPLLVRRAAASDERFEIVAGERRWRAAIEIGLEFVPCLLRELDDKQAAVAALVENLQRVDLNAMEEAAGFERLQIQFALTQEALAEVVGKSRSHVTNTLRLLRLPAPLQTHVRTGQLSAGHARALLSHADPVGAAEQVISRDLSVRQTEALANRDAKPEVTSKNLGQDLDVMAIERDLSNHLGLEVRLRSNAGRGTLSLRFGTLNQLDSLIQRLGGEPVEQPMNLTSHATPKRR